MVGGLTLDGKIPCIKWYEWLEYMLKKDEEEKEEEMHQRKVEKMIQSAEGSAGLPHQNTKPTMWKGRSTIFFFGKKRKEWSVHWQCDEEMQSLQDEPWRNEELRVCEEALPRLKEGDLAKASRFFKAKTGVGCDGFHPEVLLDDKNGRRTCGILGESGAEWQMAATSLHNDVLLDSEGCYK